MFADALVPLLAPLPLGFELPHPRHISDRVLTAILSRGANDCGNGYRFAKWQGKPNSANARKSPWNKHFANPADNAGRYPFTFDSSRTLNCPSNLIGHINSDKPANGDGDNGAFSTSGQEPRSGQGGK